MHYLFDIILSLTELKVFEPLDDKMHGILLSSALISPHKSNKYHEYLSLRDFFLPQITQILLIFAIFSPSVQRPLVPDLIILHYAQDFVLLRL